MQENNKSLQEQENVEVINTSTNEQPSIIEDTQKESKEVVNKSKEKPNKNKQKQKFIIKGKVAEKGLRHFYRCGIKFTNEFQVVKVDNAMLSRLQNEKKLTIQVVKSVR